MEPLIDDACENFINKIKQSSASQPDFVEINNLEEKLYRWSIDVIINLMLGTNNNFHEDSQLNLLVDEFANTVKKLFYTSAKLMSIPSHLADKFNLKIWKDFEICAKNSLEQCESSEIVLSLL